MTTSLIEQAFLRAIKQRRPNTAVIVHSDRGSQYMSQSYQHLLKQMRCVPCAGQKGSCPDNSMRESFFHS